MQSNGTFQSLLTATAGMALLASLGCVVDQEPGGGGATPKVVIDGSSTVQPISQAVMESFKQDHSGIQITVGRSGTSAGFEKFVLNETDISNASRPIKAEEIAKCEEAGIEYVELAIAIDGMSVVVHPSNDWCTSLTVEQLKAIWEEGSEIETWNQLDPSWPSDPIVLYGPDDASGTYDYFQEAILGKDAEGNKVEFRNDYNPSENDNALVEGVANTPGAIGYFGYAFYVQNSQRVKAIGISTDGGEPVLPDPTTIEEGTYKPLSRRLYIYVNKASLERPEVREYVEYYLSDAGLAHVSQVGYVDLPADEREASRAALQAAVSE